MTTKKRIKRNNLNYETEAAKFAGNWKKFESFGWHDAPPDADNWGIVYTHNRDSGLLDQSNAEAIEKELEKFMGGDDPDVTPEHHDHWAVGWIDGFVVRVYKDLVITPAFRALAELNAALESYPVLDDEDYSRREYGAALNAIRLYSGDAPAEYIYDWLSKHEPDELENRDDQRASPSRTSVHCAMRAVGWYPADED